ncbi:unnamed protein product [Orchesella dallaii]|uniref:Aminopeptidase n=1 Tax=Orchesella dallaii TaxID=48710 RepID=A0ABP1RD95_9HEXA
MKDLIRILAAALLLGVCLAQLPLQVKPRPRGFPGKRDGIKRNANIEPLYRLNNTFIPSHYDVEVRVILDNDDTVGPQFTAPGKVRIVGVNQERSSRIVLHTNALTVNESSITVTLTATPDQPLDISGISEDDERDFFIIELGSEIDAEAEVEIYMEHIARIPSSGVGLFYREYQTETGETRRLAATQFESVEARRMFPCFDEPDLKAVFELTVIRKDNYTSLANTELVSSTADPQNSGWSIDKYAPTVKMSSYLVAISVHDYSYAEALFGEKPARTYAPKHLIDSGGGNYTADVQAASLSFYESYYNETYKLSKMDSVAVPGFGGAMENWGMNVYGTPYILFFPGEDSEAHRNLVTLIIAHELAHQWFGNLVTLKWWNEVYLNEGLTTYTQYLGMEAVSPDLMGVEFAILDAVQYSMLYDASEYTHPLSSDVSTPDEIDSMFSTISYEKGASVLRMVDGFLTRETLRKGLQAYLKKMSFQGAQQQDLFDSLEEAASADNRLPEGLTMNNIMSSWTLQAGHPLVRVQIANATAVQISQERFRNDGSSDSEGSWYVPVTIVTEDRPSLENNIPQVWLQKDGEAQIIEHDLSKWIMINQNVTGFYRVLYDQPLQLLIQNQLESDASVISPLSRSQLLDDYFVLANQKYVSIEAALNLTRYLAQETHFTVWSTFFSHFSEIYTLFASHPGYSLLQGYLLPKLDAALAAVGVEESPSRTGALAILRADLLDWACSLGSPVCYEYANVLLAQWQANPNTSPISSVDARATLECAIVAAGGNPAFDFVFAKYQDSGNSAEIRDELLSALACTTEISVMNELLNKTLDSTSGLTAEDASSVLTKVTASALGRTVILDFLSENLEDVINVIGNGNLQPISRIFGTLRSYLSTQAQLDQLQAFVSANQETLTPISMDITVAIRVIQENISWMDTTGFEIWMWLWFL